MRLSIGPEEAKQGRHVADIEADRQIPPLVGHIGHLFGAGAVLAGGERQGAIELEHRPPGRR